MLLFFGLEKGFFSRRPLTLLEEAWLLLPLPAAGRSVAVAAVAVAAAAAAAAEEEEEEEAVVLVSPLYSGSSGWAGRT